jgi:hypothetical protein
MVLVAFENAVFIPPPVAGAVRVVAGALVAALVTLAVALL